MPVLSQSKPNGGEQAISQLQEFIADGGFEPGVRLPPERELCERLGMTRNVLRRALDALERDGAIWRHVGKGTFVSDAGGAGDPMVELGRQITPVQDDAGPALRSNLPLRAKRRSTRRARR